jgi:YHS domain-containing protein
MNPRSTLFSVLLIAGAMAAPLTAMAVDEVNVARGLSAAGAPLALHGYDPVAYFTQGKPVRGSDAITHVFEGAAYRFASEANLKQFKADPAHYAPQFGGYCAFGASVGKKFDGDPMLWTIRNDRLYLNLNPEILEMFKKDIPGNIANAEKQWTTIEHKAVSSL